VRRGLSIGAMLAALALAACSGSGGEQSTDTPTTTTEPTTTSSTSGTSTTTTADPGTSPEDQATSAYLRFWDVRLEANGDPPDPDHPDFATVATGEQLDNVIAETRDRLEQGLALRSPEPSVASHEVRVVRIDASTAELQDCFVNDGIVFRTSTGEIVDDSVVTRSVAAVMESVDGEWKLARATVIQQWEGVAGCAAASP